MSESGVRKGEPVSESRASRRSNSMPIVGLAQPGDMVLGWACADAQPGEEVEIERSLFTDAAGNRLRQRCVVSMRSRELGTP